MTKPASSRWKGLSLRPSLFLLTAVAAGASALAQTVSFGQEGQKARPASEMQSRLGAVIEQDMADRDRAYARRARAVDLREKSVQAAEQRLQSTLGEPSGAASGPAAMRGGEERIVPQPIEELARIYQAMKPSRAAAIFSALEPDVQTQIAREMRNRSVALIMASMEPGAAARLSMRLAGRSVAMTPPPASLPAPRAIAFAAPPSAPAAVMPSTRPVTTPTINSTKRLVPRPVPRTAAVGVTVPAVTAVAVPAVTAPSEPAATTKR